MPEMSPEMTSQLVAYAIKAAGAIVLLFVVWIAGGWARRVVQKGLGRASFDPTLTKFFGNMARWQVIIAGLLGVLGYFGIETTSFAAILAGAGLAIGMALSGTLGNFASGVMLLIFRPFKIGDYIEAGGTAGAVQEIAIFSTTLHSPDNVRITVPNSGIFGSTVKNYSYNETRRNDMVFGISYDDDIGKAVEVIRRALDRDERVLKDPAPVIAVGELADSSVNLLVRPWCKAPDYWALRWDLTRKIKEDLEAAGCSIPYPQQDVYMHQVSAS